MFWRGHNRRERHEHDRAIRRLLEAAATDPSEREDPPPFFVARVRAGIAAAERRATAHPLGLAARQMLPALGAAAILLTAWTGYETVEIAQERSQAVRTLFSKPGGIDEAFIAMVLLADGPEESK